MISTVLKDMKAGYTVSYAVILLGLVLQFLMGNLYVVYAMWSSDVPVWVKVFRYVLLFYPPYNFA